MARRWWITTRGWGTRCGKHEWRLGRRRKAPPDPCTRCVAADAANTAALELKATRWADDGSGVRVVRRPEVYTGPKGKRIGRRPRAVAAGE